MTVSPCIVDTYNVVPFGPISYTLGDPAIDFGSYEFVQTPDCGYTETLSVANLPSAAYLTHNSVEKDFSVDQTLDSAFLGDYNVVITS
jgi:hypothetical protein